ncbi:MAG: ribonuclease Y [Tissierellia bacterium]|nr:ribonuclease Y [Tissierellia bacterium]
MPQVNLLLSLLFSVLTFIIGFFVRRYLAEKKIGGAENYAEQIISDARKSSEAESKELILAAKEEIQNSRDELEKEIKDRRLEILNTEKRLLKREENLDRKFDSLTKKEDKLNSKLKNAEEKNARADEYIQKQEEELQRIAGLTKEEAKSIILEDLDRELAHESAKRIKEMEDKVKDESDAKAREILSVVMNRVASDHVSETTVTVVDLPSDDMKGRIIGREGRNIRVLESLTGVDLIIDDTPEAVVLSCFDPIRREIARLALTKLVQDGRIHPARIEEMVEKAQTEIEKVIKEEGERAVFETGIHNLHPELVKHLGRLKFRTSYGQNQLHHSIEVCQLAGLMAEELGANVKIAKRGALLHDIGKSIDREMEGTHVELGVNLARRYKEPKEVIHCIEAHHNDVEPSTVEAILVQAADTISAARPGARRETLVSYIKRLEKLEEIANSFEGIKKSFAIQAGREVRILVRPDKVTDDEMTKMAYDVAKRIEDEMQYPGQIKVNVIKEVRRSHVAK